MTLGYGYQTWRALVGLLLTIAFAIALSLSLGDQALTETNAGGSGTAALIGSIVPTDDAFGADDVVFARRCSQAEEMLVGIDLSLPIVKTSVRDNCTFRNSPEGTALMAAGLLTQLAGWAFATLFVAGFTGAVRKT